MDGHDLRRPPCRNEQRMGSVHDVHRASERLDWWPFGPMPEQVEHTYRDTAVDHVHVQLGAEPFCGPVLPRAGEYRHSVVAGCGIGPDELVDVLADARAAA